MKNTRRTFVRTLAVSTALILGGTLAGCSAGTAGNGSSANPGGGKPDTSRPANEIHIYAFGDAAASVEQAAADRFNKTSKVKVIVDKGADGGADYATQVRTTIGTKNSPDIFMSWGSAGIADFVKAGAVLSLNDFIDENPKLKSSFLPSVFNEEVVSGQSYGIPMRGVGPVVLYYNKSVLDKNGLTPAKSLDELQSQVSKLSGAGVTPVALSGADKWPTLMWFEYLYTRAAGNDALNKGLKGDADFWSSSASKKALTDLSALVKSGAFGTKYASVKYGNDGSPKLLSTGKAAYELMGNWNYATIAAGDKNFAGNDLGWTAFPTVSGTSGTDAQLTGNLSNYYNVAGQHPLPRHRGQVPHRAVQRGLPEG